MPDARSDALKTLDTRRGAGPLPSKVVNLSEALAETVARLALAGIEPMLTLDDWPFVLNCSRREVERMKSAGTLPPPDFHVGRMPRWKAATVRAYIGSPERKVAR